MGEINTEYKSWAIPIMVEFDNLCRSEGLEYSLAYGTLLGCVREKGMIPWDDDIDFMMPRPDYERLIDLCKNNKPKFQFLCCENSNFYCYEMGKIYDKKVDIEGQIKAGERISDVLNKGKYIDVFPIDGMGNDKKIAEKYYKQTLKWLWLLIIVRLNATNEDNFLKMFIKKLGHLMGMLIKPYKLVTYISKRNQKYEYNSSKYVASIVLPYGIKNILEKEIFDEYTEKEFEGKVFKVISKYDYYLSQIYGNYMVPRKTRN